MKRKAGIPPVIPPQPPGPPGFGYTQHVVQMDGGNGWETILYCDSYMEAHRAMKVFEKENIGDQIYRVSHEVTDPSFASFIAAKQEPP